MCHQFFCFTLTWLKVGGGGGPGGGGGGGIGILMNSGEVNRQSSALGILTKTLKGERIRLPCAISSKSRDGCG